MKQIFKATDARELQEILAEAKIAYASDNPSGDDALSALYTRWARLRSDVMAGEEIFASDLDEEDFLALDTDIELFLHAPGDHTRNLWEEFIDWVDKTENKENDMTLLKVYQTNNRSRRKVFCTEVETLADFADWLASVHSEDDHYIFDKNGNLFEAASSEIDDEGNVIYGYPIVDHSAPKGRYWMGDHTYTAEVDPDTITNPFEVCPICGAPVADPDPFYGNKHGQTRPYTCGHGHLVDVVYKDGSLHPRYGQDILERLEKSDISQTRLLTIDEVANIFRVTTRTVHTWVASEKLHPVRIENKRGSKLLFSRDEVNTLKNARKARQ